MQEQSPSAVQAVHAAARRKAILVLGMHRSGTSALGGVLQALGAGGPKTSIPPDGFNQRGYFESMPLFQAHDELLVSIGSRWDDWRRIDPQRFHSTATDRQRASIRALLGAEFGDAPLFFIKDPRICRFVPFIASVLAEMNVDVAALLTLRNPLEVANSLRRRDEISLPKALLAWLRHMLEAEHHSRQMPRSFLSYPALMTDWRRSIDAAAEAAGIAWPARTPRSEAEIDRFLSADLHHEKAADDLSRHSGVPSIVRTAYEIFSVIAATGETTELRDRLDAVRARLDDASDLFDLALEGEEAVAAGLRRELDQRHRVFESERLALLGAQLEGLTTKYEGLVRAHGELTAAHDVLAYRLRDLVNERDALARDRAGLVAERDALTASLSWRLTAPLRWMRKPAAGAKDLPE